MGLVYGRKAAILGALEKIGWFSELFQQYLAALLHVTFFYLNLSKTFDNNLIFRRRSGTFYWHPES